MGLATVFGGEVWVDLNYCVIPKDGGMKGDEPVSLLFREWSWFIRE